MSRTRSVRAAAVLFAGVVVGPGLICAPAASGAEGSRAFCVVRQTVKAPAGLTAMSGRVDYTGAGTIDCDGDVRGHPVIGPGTWTESGFVEGSCATGVPNFKVEFTVPTEDGKQTIRLNGRARYFGAGGLRPEEPQYPGGFVFYPTEGDCVTSPVTQAEAIVYGVLLS